MEIVVAKSGGFCQGVRKAVNKAMNIAPENTFIYGEIIHNPLVVEQIAARGITTVERLEDVPDGATLVIRSHGVGKAVYDECARRGIRVDDCTCEFVKRTQKIVAEHYAMGEQIVIIGERAHPEVVGLNGWCEESAYIISSPDADLSVLPQKKLCVVAQTTYSNEKFEKIIKNLNDNGEKIVAVFKTICYTTIGRQNEASELAKSCDAVLVIGGLNSSNTNKLYDICKQHCDFVFRLENVVDFDYKKIKRFKKVGIVTGASTPDMQTQEVLTKMAEVAKEAEVTMMDEVVAQMDNQQKFTKGMLLKATISSADAEGVYVLLPNTKKEVKLDKNEVECEVYNADEYAAKVGEEIELMVVSVNPVKLSQKAIAKVKEEEALVADIKDGKEFSVECTGFNKGGLTAAIGSYAVFVPAREIRSGFVKDLEKYVGKKLRLKVLEIKTERRKEIIASQKAVFEEEKAAKEAAKAAKEAEFFASVQVGDVVEGKVERVTNFGAFVSVNGFDCLAHISDLSWTGVKAVSDVLEIGKKYDFKVLKIDEANKKVSIGYKQLQPQPWDLAAEKYAEGDVIHGKVVRIISFGAFVEVEKGIDGMVHVSQISHEYLENPAAVLAIGQEVDAKILRLNCEEKKMTLSIKALEPKPEAPEKKKDAEDDGEKKGKKTRAPKVSDEMTEWSDDASSGASIGDLIKKA